jgi:hypothetical protein
MAEYKANNFIHFNNSQCLKADSQTINILFSPGCKAANEHLVIPVHVSILAVNWPRHYWTLWRYTLSLLEAVPGNPTVSPAAHVIERIGTY